MRSLFCILLSLAVVTAPPVLAEIYRSVDKDGNVIFSDKPARGAEKIKLPPLPTYTPRALPAPAPAEAELPLSEPAIRYQSLAILSPAPDATVWDNSGNVSVDVALVPELDIQAGDRIQALVDGRPSGEAQTGLRLLLENIDRGSHELQVRVINEQGKPLMTTGSLRFHVKRQSTHFRAPAAP